MDGSELDVGGHRVLLLDSISVLAAQHQGRVVVSGSHGGLGSARFALAHPPALVVFNDAGVGKDQAGIAALAVLASFNIPALAVSAASARIGDAFDTLDSGRVSHLNDPARALGIAPGERLKEVLAALDPAKVDRGRT